jgi:hypothetical protein
MAAGLSPACSYCTWSRAPGVPLSGKLTARAIRTLMAAGRWVRIVSGAWEVASRRARTATVSARPPMTIPAATVPIVGSQMPGKEAGASLRLAEGQYFPWFIFSLPVGGSLRVHGRGSRRLPAWRLLEGHVGLLGDVRMASAVKQHRDKRSAPTRVGWRSSGRAAVRSSPGTGLDLLSDRAGKAPA